MSNIIMGLSEQALSTVMKRLEKEVEALVGHPCGVFNFSESDAYIGSAVVHESVTNLGITKVGHRLVMPDGMFHCLVYGIHKNPLVECEPEDVKRYILLLKLPEKECWWVEGDKKMGIFKITKYDDIPMEIRQHIERALVEKAWHALKGNAEIFDR